MPDAYGTDTTTQWKDNVEGKKNAVWKRGGKQKNEILKKYRTCINTSKKWREDEGYDKTWKRLLDLYRNKHFPGGLTEEDRIAINISFSTINTIVPSVAVNHPQVTVNPRNPEVDVSAETVEACVNYWWRHFNWRKETKRTVKDSLVVGHGWVKVGWRYAEKEQEIEPERQAEMLAEQQEEAGAFAEENPEFAAALPTDDDIAAGLPTTETIASVDQPFVERVSYMDVYVDPEATCMEDMKWIAQKIVRKYDDVREDDSYNRGARRSVKADAGTNPRWRDDGTMYSDEVKRVTLWEYYDIEKHYYCVFAQSGDDFLLDPSEMPYAYGNPFVFLADYEVPDQFYPIGELEALEPIQHELNAVRSDMMNHRKRWQRKYLAKGEYLDEDAQAALESDVDGAIAFISDNDVDLNSIVIPVQQIPLDAQMYQYSDVIEQDADLVTGVSEYQRGALSETRRTATEASIIQDAANARSADKLANVEDFMVEIAKRVTQLAQTHLTQEEVARIVDMNGAMQWVPFDREAVQGEYDFEVEAGSTQPKNEQFRRQQAVQMANTMAPFVTMGVINPQMLAMTLLRDGFGIKNPEQYMQMMPPPMIDPETGEQLPPEAGGQPPMQPPGQPPGPTEGSASPMPGPNVPPELLAQAQLEGQVGLSL